MKEVTIVATKWYNAAEDMNELKISIGLDEELYFGFTLPYIFNLDEIESFFRDLEIPYKVVDSRKNKNVK